MEIKKTSTFKTQKRAFETFFQTQTLKYIKEIDFVEIKDFFSEISPYGFIPELQDLLSVSLQQMLLKCFSLTINEKVPLNGIPELESDMIVYFSGIFFHKYIELRNNTLNKFYRYRYNMYSEQEVLITFDLYCLNTIMFVKKKLFNFFYDLMDVLGKMPDKPIPQNIIKTIFTNYVSIVFSFFSIQDPHTGQNQTKRPNLIIQETKSQKKYRFYFLALYKSFINSLIYLDLSYEDLFHSIYFLYHETKLKKIFQHVSLKTALEELYKNLKTIIIFWCKSRKKMKKPLLIDENFFKILENPL